MFYGNFTDVRKLWRTLITKKIKRIVFWGIIAFYAVSVISYSNGKIVAEIAGLEYRYWVEQSFRCIVWFVPVLKF